MIIEDLNYKQAVRFKPKIGPIILRRNLQNHHRSNEFRTKSISITNEVREATHMLIWWVMKDSTTNSYKRSPKSHAIWISFDPSKKRGCQSTSARRKGSRECNLIDKTLLMENFIIKMLEILGKVLLVML